MSTTSSTSQPIPIHRLAHHHYLYSAPSISHLRANHSTPGTLIGTLPQCPQQNVFLGLPLLLSHSEARRLVTTGAAYIVDDVAVHKAGLRGLGKEEKERWVRGLREEGLEVARSEAEGKAKERERVLGGIDEGKREKVREMRRREKEKKASEKAKAKSTDRGMTNSSPDESEKHHKPAALVAVRGEFPATTNALREARAGSIDDDDNALFSSSAASTFFSQEPPPTTPRPKSSTPSTTETTTDNESLFDPSTPQPQRSNTPGTTTSAPATPLPPSLQEQLKPHPITPTLSTPLLRPPSSSAIPPPRPTPPSHLHAHLHAQSYFLLPGLRFGAHFNAYPGDPLRFHAHFACRAYTWEEGVPLLEVVGGGRLGTGVKKGFLVGGKVEAKETGSGDGGVRCFTVEWGGM